MRSMVGARGLLGPTKLLLAWLVVGLLPSLGFGRQLIEAKLLPPEERGGSVVTLVEGEIGKSGVLYSGTYAWPEGLLSGWFPSRLELRNTSAESAVVRLLAEQSYGEEDRVTRSVGLAPGERVELELLLRARTGGMNQYGVQLSVGGDRVVVAGLSPSGAGGVGHAHEVMYFAATQPPAGSQERWTASWRVEEEPDPRSVAFRTGHVHGHGSTLDARVTARTLEHLSANWQAYSSLDTVLLDLSGGWPEQDDLEALLAWCRTGGRLVLVGVPLDELRERGVLSQHLQERLEASTSVPGDPSDFEQRGLHAFALGFGHLVVHDAGASTSSGGFVLMEPSGGEPALALVADREHLGNTWMRSRGRTRFGVVLGMLQGFEDLPLRGLMLLLLVFACVLGPANFYWVKRKGRPLLLLLTVPGLSLAMSLALLAYGVFSQGLDTKVHTRSFSVLDQRTQQAVAAEVRNIFAGSSPGAGLRPEPGTAVVPEKRFWNGSWRGEHMFTADLTDGRLLGGDYLPVRQPVGQLLLTDRTSHLRLEAIAGGAGVKVVNGLGAAVSELLLRASDGSYHRLVAPLADGAEAGLTPIPGPEVERPLAAELVWFQGEPLERELAPGSYLARLDRHILRDDLGLELNELSGDHLVLGLLEVSEEGRR